MPKVVITLGSLRSTTDGSTVGWTEIRDLALRAEAIGFDTVWSSGELIGRLVKGGLRYGFWDGVAIPAATLETMSPVLELLDAD